MLAPGVPGVRPQPGPSPGEGGPGLCRPQGPVAAAAAAAASFQVYLPSLTGARQPLQERERRDGELSRPVRAGVLDRSPGRGGAGGDSDLQEALRRFRGRLRLALRARAEGAQYHLFFPSPGLGPTLPRPPSGGSPACICPRGRSGRRRAWPRLPQPALPLRPPLPQPLSRPGSLPPSFRASGPGADLGPPCSVRPLLSFSLPPALCSWLWGWAP